MPPTRDVEILVTFLPASEGGRAIAPVSGYRPHFYYGGHHWVVELTFAEEPVIAGKPVRAAAAFLSPQDHEGQLTAGMAFQIRDGQKVVGSGHVTAIVDLAASAARARAAGL